MEELKNDMISRSALLATYDAAHKGQPGGARKLIENAPAVDGWISVKDRLPEDEYECLIIDIEGWYHLGWFKEDMQQWIIDGVVCGDGYITHWIKLPEPPKEAERCAVD